MTDIYYKISRIALFSILIISLIFLILFYFGKAVEGTENTDSYEPLMTGKILGWAYFLLAIALGASLFFFFGNLLKDTKKLINFGVALVAFGIIILISYLFSSRELLNLDVMNYPDNNPSALKFADTMIYSTYILLGVAFIAILYSSFSRVAK